jgi:pimeloyl-ACP methyl ester carboxylesterase
VNIAVARVGRGMPVVCTPIVGAHLEYDWDDPTRAELWQFLADRFELIRYDSRGSGFSDRNATEFSFETFQLDLEAVVAALGLQRYAFFGNGVGRTAAPAIAHAARHPDRVSKLVLHGGFPQDKGANVWWTQFVWMLGRDWEFSLGYLRGFLAEISPGLSPEQVRACVDRLPKTASLETALRQFAAALSVDVRDFLPHVRAPTLVLHSRDCRLQSLERAQGTATAIPHATLLVLPTDNDMPLPVEPAWPVLLNALEAFLSEG